MTALIGSPWQEVGERCYRRRYSSYDLNVGVVEGADALLVYDTRCHAGEARELLDEIRAFGPRPVRWVVNSHWHFDHSFGNATFRDAGVRGPGGHALQIWGHRAMRDELVRWSDGKRVRLVAERPEWRAEIEALEIVPPDHLVDDLAVVDLGDRTVRLQHFGPAHTAGDLVALVDDARVIFAGDLVEESAPPAYGSDSHPFGWPVCNAAMLERIATDATVVPGHGDIVDRQFVVAQLSVLTAVAELIRELYVRGVEERDALSAGRGRWPFSEDDLGEVIEPGYAALRREPLT